MQYDLHSLLFPPMAAIGYKKANETNWTLRMPEIMILSTVGYYTDAPRFDINLGIVFNPSSDPVSWRKFRHVDARFNTTVYRLLLHLGESPEQLDKVFFTGTESEIKSNIPVIMDLIKQKVIPYFNNWNDYSWLVKHFKEEIFQKRFNIYADPAGYKSFFRRQEINA